MAVDGKVCGFHLRFQLVSPLFLGGAAQQAELRVPSIKAMLRFWHRAVDPAFSEPVGPGGPRRESSLWGAIGRRAGQSKVLLAITEQRLESRTWKELPLDRFNSGEGRHRKNGVRYLGYPFDLRDRDECSFFLPGGTFTLRVLLRARSGTRFVRGELLDTRELQTATATLWLLGHLGSLGSRSRRGFGALALLDWAPFGDAPAELKRAMAALPLLAATSTRDEWHAGFREGLEVLRGWFGTYDAPGHLAPHPHLGADTRAVLAERGFAQDQWLEALNALGRRLQDYRVRRNPDYDIAKNHLRALGREGGAYMRAAPGRVTFGLPLAFRFGSLRTKPNAMTLVPFEGRSAKERQPSLLFTRLALLSSSLYPLFLRLSGAVPGVDNTVGVRGAERGELRADHHALDAFMDTLE